MAEQITKLKKKQWQKIIAPKQFNEVVLGETLVYEPNAMLGKTLRVSLMNLINDTKKHNITIHFKVIGVDNDKAKTEIIGYQINPSSVKRFVRRASEKIDMSFTSETADNVLLRIKPLIVAKANVKGSVAAKLRSSTLNFFIKTIKKMKYDEVINDLIPHKLQDSMKQTLNKVYPLKTCEIRYLGIEEREKPQEGKEVIQDEIKKEALNEEAPKTEEGIKEEISEKIQEEG